MDHHRQQGSEPSASTKVERRITERNRRNNMRDLYSRLNSLRPDYNPRVVFSLSLSLVDLSKGIKIEMLPLPDQIDEAINYIRSLETKVKTANEKKEGLLMARKRSRGSSSSASETKRSLQSPKLEIHEMGSSLEVILTCEFDNQFMFNEIIRILHEENIEVISANSSMAGDSMINVVHAQIPQSSYQFGATKVSDRLKRFMNRSVSDVELELSDFEIENEMWELPDLSASKGFPNPL